MMTVLVILVILAILILPAFGRYQERARQVACVARLKGLHVATSGFMSTNEGRWPRISTPDGDDIKYAREWHEVLSSHGLGWQDLTCPSMQRKLGSPNVADPKLHRMDFISTYFDNKPGTPMKWPNMPWFAERQDMHGTGPLVILANGAVVDLKEARRLTSQ